MHQKLLTRELPSGTTESLRDAYEALMAAHPNAPICVRSCFAIEDLPTSSFAGAFETVPSVSSFHELCRAVRFVFASAFGPRAVSEMQAVDFDSPPAMSVAIQIMVGGEGWLGGVAHTQCPELAPFPLMQLSVSESAAVVTAGTTIPEEYLLRRDRLRDSSSRVVVQSQPGSNTKDCFALGDDQLRSIGQQLLGLEAAFALPLEVEYMLSPSGMLHVLQARPQCVGARQDVAHPDASISPLCEGMPVGHGRVTGTAVRVNSAEEALAAPPNSILVAAKTDPDWVPAVRRSAGLVAAIGARTSHVSRTARESGVLAVVGCGTETDRISNGTLVTLICSDGVVGAVYAGEINGAAQAMPVDDVRIDSVADAFALSRSCKPSRVFFDLSRVLRSYRLPQSGIGQGDRMTDRIRRRIAGHADVRSFAVRKLVEASSLASIAFSGSRLHLRLAPDDPWAHLLPDVLEECWNEYDVPADADWYG